MAVVENAGANAITSPNHDNDAAAAADHHQQSTKAAATAAPNSQSTKPADQNFHLMPQKMSNGHHQPPINGNGVPLEKKLDGEEDDGREGFKRDMRDLEEMLSKLNPMAKEFVPPSLSAFGGGGHHKLMLAPHAATVAAAAAGHFGFNANGFLLQQQVNSGVPNANSFRRVGILHEKKIFFFRIFGV